MSNSLKAGRNARWIAVSQIARYGIQLIGLAVLARLIPPDAYGVMAMALVATNFANLLRDMGAGAAIIQRKKLSAEVCHTVFWSNIAVGVLLMLALALTAPLLARAFHSPTLGPVLLALSITFPIASSAAVHQSLFERNSNFRTLARIEIVSACCGVLAGISAAIIGADVFSLVIQSLTSTILSAAQLWISNKWRPKRHWDTSEFFNVWRFSSYLTAFNLLNYLSRNVDTIVIGRMLGSGALGIYSQAYRLMLLPLQTFTSVASRALFPVLSRVTSSNELAAIYLRSLTLVIAVTAGVVAWLWGTREPLVRVLLGPQWGQVADLLFWLAPVTLIQTIVSSVGPLLMAIGRTDLLMRLGIIGTLLTVSSFLIGAHWGLAGVASCYLLANALNAIPCLITICKCLDIPASALFKAIAPFVAASALIAFALSQLNALLISDRVGPVTGLIFLSLVGTGIWLGLTSRTAPYVLKELKTLLFPSRVIHP